MNILITSIGKRVQLIKYLKKQCNVIGVDCGYLAPAIEFVGKFYVIPKFIEEGYVEKLLEICNKEKVSILIPLHEGEFYILNENRQQFNNIGTKLLLSNKDILDICQDKFNTYKFFIDNNFNCAKSYYKDEIKNIILQNKTIEFPLIIKPTSGMGSTGVFKVKNLKELNFFIDYIDEPIIQQCLIGTEYTIDCLCDMEGNVISIVPRERLEVRAGEVSKSRTVYNKKIIDETYRLLKSLKNPIGPFTVQCMVDKKENISFIEINPRFGGGVPLTFEAGVDYGKYFNHIAEHKEITPIIGKFKEITMLRYDEAVFK